MQKFSFILRIITLTIWITLGVCTIVAAYHGASPSWPRFWIIYIVLLMDEIGLTFVTYLNQKDL